MQTSNLIIVACGAIALAVAWLWSRWLPRH
jgi:hypothetical protein